MYDTFIYIRIGLICMYDRLCCLAVSLRNIAASVETFSAGEHHGFQSASAETMRCVPWEKSRRSCRLGLKRTVGCDKQRKVAPLLIEMVIQKAEGDRDRITSLSHERHISRFGFDIMRPRRVYIPRIFHCAPGPQVECGKFLGNLCHNLRRFSEGDMIFNDKQCLWEA